MSRQQLLSVGGAVVLGILFLVGCGASASTAVSDAPAATSAPEEQAVITPTPEPATSTPQPPTATPTPESPPATEEAVSAVEPLKIGDPDRGREIFENGGEKYADKPNLRCIHCHSSNGGEVYIPQLQGISERAGNRVPELSAAEYLRQSILEPDAYIVEDTHYRMGRIHSVLLSEEEIDDLVAFMLTQ